MTKWRAIGNAGVTLDEVVADDDVEADNLIIKRYNQRGNRKEFRDSWRTTGYMLQYLENGSWVEDK